jgi:hypothetical protein
MAGLLTCVTLSAKPHTREDLPEGVEYYNHVSTITNMAELHRERLASLAGVKTPLFVWVDDDDPFVWNVPQSNFAGLQHGDEVVYTNNNQMSELMAYGAWDAETHLGTPLLIHKAICNTQQALRVASKLPQGDHYTEHLLYYLLAAWRGAENLSCVTTHWYKRQAGFHGVADQAQKNTVLWLMQNRNRVLGELNAFG